MSNMVDWALAYVNTVAPACCSETITYARGGHSVDLLAIIDDPKQLDFSLLGQMPGMRDMQQASPVDLDQPFNFEAGLLIINGHLTTPESGDEITATIGGVAGVFEVLSPMGGGLPWEWINNRTRIRVHSKYVRAA